MNEMKKLALSLDDLAVESFDTSDAENGVGTVFGREDDQLGTGSGTCQGVSCESTCFQRLCTCTNGMETACDYSCGTCLNECDTEAGCLTRDGYPGC